MSQWHCWRLPDGGQTGTGQESGMHSPNSELHDAKTYGTKNTLQTKMRSGVSETPMLTFPSSEVAGAPWHHRGYRGGALQQLQDTPPIGTGTCKAGFAGAAAGTTTAATTAAVTTATAITAAVTATADTTAAVATAAAADVGSLHDRTGPQSLRFCRGSTATAAVTTTAGTVMCKAGL